MKAKVAAWLPESIVSEKNRTEPSPRHAKTPPGCRLLAPGNVGPSWMFPLPASPSQLALLGGVAAKNPAYDARPSFQRESSTRPFQVPVRAAVQSAGALLPSVAMVITAKAPWSGRDALAIAIRSENAIVFDRPSVTEAKFNLFLTWLLETWPFWNIPRVPSIWPSRSR